jgi:hypothetical protein
MATDWQADTPRPGDKTNELKFHFYDGMTLIDDYTVTYIDYGSEESKEQDKPVTQKAFEAGFTTARQSQSLKVKQNFIHYWEHH